MKLGPVGGRIVTEVFVGMLVTDRSSVLWQPGFRPDPSFPTTNGKFGFREIILSVTKPPSSVPPPSPS